MSISTSSRSRSSSSRSSYVGGGMRCRRQMLALVCTRTRTYHAYTWKKKRIKLTPHLGVRLEIVEPHLCKLRMIWYFGRAYYGLYTASWRHCVDKSARGVLRDWDERLLFHAAGWDWGAFSRPGTERSAQQQHPGTWYPTDIMHTHW